MIVDACQRFTLGRESRRPAGELIRRSAFDVEPIEEAAVARAFVALHHYAPDASPSPYRYGLYQRGVLEGVALFGPPPSMLAHAKVFPSLASDEAMTLGRFVLLQSVPGNAESFFVARCFEHLRRAGITAIESCADPQPRERADGTKTHRGHLGIIYQATNGHYVGKTDPNTLHLLPDGTVLSKRAQSKIRARDRGWETRAAKLVAFGAEPLQPDEDATAWLATWRGRLCRSMRHYGNHRYLWCLDKRRRKEVLAAPRLPYPKEDGWKEGGWKRRLPEGPS